MDAQIEALAARIRDAVARRARLRIRGGGTKDFYGHAPEGEPLETRALAGIRSYDPTELVFTALAGTPLREIEALLAANGQMLAFEPPHFGVDATLGGCIAAGLAGPRRMAQGLAHGGVRDYVLGATMLDGRGELLSFGGVVMKNVAGYDVSRALAGSLGVLGVIVELSIKVLPVAQCELTLVQEAGTAEALTRLNRWAGQPQSVNASCAHDGRLWLRLAGAGAAVQSAAKLLGGEKLDAEAARGFWQSIREHTHPFFGGTEPLWRMSLPPTAALPVELDEPLLIEWRGALRWLRSVQPASQLMARARAAGGHATLFRHGDRSQEVFTPLPAPLLAIHRRLRQAFDPDDVFDGGRMYRELRTCR